MIAFTYGGQIWRVDRAGGEAVALTDGVFYCTRPVWSPCGTTIAFASSKHGNFDVFVMPARGGSIRRLTFHSSDNMPVAFSQDGAHVLFSSRRKGTPGADYFRALPELNTQLYAVPAAGGRERMLLPVPALEAKPGANGSAFLYESRLSVEQPWRKGDRSDAARAIWLYDGQADEHRRLTTFRGENRHAVWGPGEETVFYLSERSGSFNVWTMSLAGDEDARQVTDHEFFPVRHLSVDRKGTLAYSYAGEIWIKEADGEPTRVPIHISQGSMLDDKFLRQITDQATELVVSPCGSQLAVVARGEVFVVSSEGGRARRITHTPQEERSVRFRPDGRALLYASERHGKWDIYETSLVEEDDHSFLDGTRLRETKILGDAGDQFHPLYSPCGRRIAYVEDRAEIRVFDRETGRITTALPPGYLYIYFDDDSEFAWSPCGDFLVCNVGFDAQMNIALLDASGEQAPFMLVESGFRDRAPGFVLDGHAVLWFSDRNSLRQLDNRSLELDAYLCFLGPEAFQRFTRRSAGPRGHGSPASPGGYWDLDNLHLRTLRMTPFPVRPSVWALSSAGDNLLVVDQKREGLTAAYLFGEGGNVQQLFARPSVDGEIWAFCDLEFLLYAIGPGGLERVNLHDGASESLPVLIEITWDFRAEMAYIFEHVWRLTQMKFYDPDMHGVDWEAVREAYEPFLPHIHWWEDLTELISEMAGELNASHTGASFYRDAEYGDATASLALFYDHGWEADGMRIAGVIPGGPADFPGSPLQQGALILAVNDQPVLPDMDIHPLLNHKAEEPVLLTVLPPDSEEALDVTVTPVSQRTAWELAAEEWINHRKRLTDELSGGRIGYVHIPRMNVYALQRAFGELFGPLRNKEAVVLDVRFNLGGHLHDQLIAMLSGSSHLAFTDRAGHVVSGIPESRWTRPQALLANVASYSDASVFPYLYQQEQLGPLIGDRIPGTGTYVLTEPQMDRKITYMLPQLGIRDRNGKWLENREIEPDILVRNDPCSVARGEDKQLEAAVRHLMRKLDGSPELVQESRETGPADTKTDFEKD